MLSKRKLLGTICEYAEAILVAVLLALFARAFIFQIFEIPSSSMEETLLIGDHVLVNKFVFGAHRGPWNQVLPYRDPAHGDVVVFRSPQELSQDLVKRIAGLPFETVRIDGKGLYRNGFLVHEPYVVFRDPRTYEPAGETPLALRPRDFMPARPIPSGQMFVLGDNRDFSRDSRYWGTAPMALLKGRAVLVLWSVGPNRAEDAVSEAKQGIPQFLDRAIHFFRRMRWQRTFHTVR